MLSPLSRRSDWTCSSLVHPVVSAFPDRVVGSACASTFSRLARRSLGYGLHTRAVTVYRDSHSEGFSHFVASMTAPVASGWSVSPGGSRTHWNTPPFTAHTPSGRSPPTALREEICLEPRVNQASEWLKIPLRRRSARSRRDLRPLNATRSRTIGGTSQACVLAATQIRPCANPKVRVRRLQ